MLIQVVCASYLEKMEVKAKSEHLLALKGKIARALIGTHCVLSLSGYIDHAYKYMMIV